LDQGIIKNSKTNCYNLGFPFSETLKRNAFFMPDVATDSSIEKAICPWFYNARDCQGGCSARAKLLMNKNLRKE